MVDFLKGNYRLQEGAKREASTREDSQKSLTDNFEDSVLAKLGGSICFVAKGKTFLWTGETGETASS